MPTPLDNARQNVHRLLSERSQRRGDLLACMAKTQRRHLDEVLREFIECGWLSREVYVNNGPTGEFLHWRGPKFTGETREFRGDGDPNSYMAVHFRLRRERGKAAEYACSCGEPAAQWAYDHLDSDEVFGPSNSGRTDSRAYSLKSEHYNPLCIACHVALDGAIVRQ